jgi:hypothetical protein
MNPQQPLRFGVIGSLYVTSGDSLVRDNRREVASQHGETDFPALCPISFTMCASYLAFYVDGAVIVRQR